MKPLFTVLFLFTIVLFSNAQTSNLVFFADKGELFTLYINGEQKNASPLANVKVTGLTGDGIKARVVFQSAEPELNKFMMLTPNEETTVSILKNKKGVYTFRLISSSPIAAGNADTVYPTSTSTVSSSTPSSNATTETTTVNTTTTAQNSQSTNISMNVNGVTISSTATVADNQTSPGNVSMNVSTNMPMTEVTSTATTTSSSSNSSYNSDNSGNSSSSSAKSDLHDWSSCGLASYEYTDALNSIKSKSFTDGKMTVAKQILKNNCVTTEQVKGMSQLFSFEEDKLAFVKFAYDHTSDKKNFYKVNDVFTYDASIQELNKFLESK
jgi:hypothetical protein